MERTVFQTKPPPRGTESFLLSVISYLLNTSVRITSCAEIGSVTKALAQQISGRISCLFGEIGSGMVILYQGIQFAGFSRSSSAIPNVLLISHTFASSLVRYCRFGIWQLPFHQDRKISPIFVNLKSRDYVECEKLGLAAERRT